MRGPDAEVGVNPWEMLDPRGPEFVLPIDRRAVEAHNQLAKPVHQFRLDMVPEPYMGRPDAPVVLLTGNPRYRDDDLATHARADLRQRLMMCVKQEELDFPLVWLDPDLKATSGGIWYRQRFRRLCEVVGVQALSQNLAIYESLPYHSMELKQPREAIPSQAYTNTLVERSLSHGRIVIWQRAPWNKMLDLDLSNNPSVVRPRSLQSSYLSPGNLGPEVFERVVEALRS